MLWLEFVQKHKQTLKLYFADSCSRCMYGEVVSDNIDKYLEDDVDCEAVDCEAIDYEVIDVYMSEVREYQFKSLCGDCILGIQKNTETILFDIFRNILERETTSVDEFENVLQILNKTCILRCPKEALFIYYVNRCKMIYAMPLLYKNAIIKLLESGIDVNYHYSHVRYENIFNIFPGRSIIEGCNDITLKLLYILRDCGYDIIFPKNGLIIMSEIGRFLILG